MPERAFFMDQNLQNNIWYILLGAILTFIAMLIIELIRTYIEKRGKSSSFRLITRLELISLGKSLDKLKTVFEYKNYFEYVVIDEIRKGITTLDTRHHEFIYLTKERQEKLINLLSDLSKFTSNIKGVQDFFYDQQRKIVQDKQDANRIKKKLIKRSSFFETDKENQESYDKKCTQLLIDLVEINRDIDEMIDALD